MPGTVEGVSEEEAVRALARLSRLMERAVSDVGLSLAHFRVLAAVAEGEIRASHVARRLALGKPTVTASVDALCRRGLLERHEIEGDQRVAALHLTHEGRLVLTDAERAMTDRLRVVLAHTEQPQAGVQALVRLGRGLDVVVEERLADQRPA
jgi:DNA-binding MarR family transcriptional regulator